MKPLAGFVPFSTVDFPGALASVFFFQGCPWRCSYCHNPHLLSKSEACAQRPMCLDEFSRFLEKRRGLIDGVVFSGGEPLTDPDLALWLECAQGWGFQVGLHTSGSLPSRLESVLPWLDWVGLDIKHSFDAYESITQVSESGLRASQSLDLLLRNGLRFECRTTLHAQLHRVNDVLQIAHELRRRGVKSYALQVARTEHCLDPSFQGAERFQLNPSLEGWLSQLFPDFSVRQAA